MTMSDLGLVHAPVEKPVGSPRDVQRRQREAGADAGEMRVERR